MSKNEQCYKTSGEWLKIYQQEFLEKNIDIKIHNKDGWKTDNCNFYTDIITYNDFIDRLTQSAIIWKKVYKDE
ncbi:MAG: hypothetical protein J7L15_00570 [Clostridiales bacterium]|nr:hypothetical protein [Clostridiales bacterium]